MLANSAEARLLPEDGTTGGSPPVGLHDRGNFATEEVDDRCGVPGHLDVRTAPRRQV